MKFLTNPIEWWIDPFVENAFMRDVLWVSLLVVLTTSVVGTWVVLRGMSFLGDALAHGVMPGIAVGFIFGFNVTLGAMGAALLMVGGVDFIRKRSPLPDDTSIGLLFVGFLSLAVVILSSNSAQYIGDLNRFLFGSVTGVDGGDVARQAAVAAVVVAVAAIFHRAFLVMSFDETQAQLLGLRPKLSNLVLLGLLAVAIVASFETVGSLLVFAFLIAPPASAALLVRKVPVIMLTAVGLGAISVIIGLLISFHSRSASGATMALVSVVIFYISLGFRSLVSSPKTRLVSANV